MGIPPGRLDSLPPSTALQDGVQISEEPENFSKAEEPVMWEADTTTADLPVEEELQVEISRRRSQRKEKTNCLEINEINKGKEITDKARTEYVALQLPPKRLGARFTPACWRCRECGAKEESVISYAHHLMQHLKPPNKHLKNFPCSLCHKKFFTQKLLDEHETSRHGLSTLVPPVKSTIESLEASCDVDDPMPIQACSKEMNQVKDVETSQNIFKNTGSSFSKADKNSETKVLLSSSCISPSCVMELHPNESSAIECSVSVNISMNLSKDPSLSTSQVSHQNTTSDVSEEISGSLKIQTSILQGHSEKSDETIRRLVAVMGENALQNLLIPIDQQKDIDSLIQSFQQPSREKLMPHLAKVPETILNHEFFTRVAGDTVVRDVKSLLSMGYSLQFLVENEDGSSSLVDVLSTGTNRSTNRTSSGPESSSEMSSQQLVIMANGNVPETLPLALQNILPSSVPIVPSVIDTIVNQASPAVQDASLNSVECSTNSRDISLTSCLSSESSFLSKQDPTTDSRSPLGSLLPSSVANVCYDSVIPYSDSNSGSTSLMEMTLGRENLEREELDYELGSLGLPLTVDDTNSADYIINSCNTPPTCNSPPRNNGVNDGLCIEPNTDLNTPVKLLDQCMESSLSTDVLAFDFGAGSVEASNSVLCGLHPEEKNVCRDGLTKDFSDLIAADADSSNVMLSIQPADSTAELRKDGCIPNIEVNNTNEKEKSGTSLEWIRNEGLLLSVDNGSSVHVSQTVVLNQQSPMETCYESSALINKDVAVLKDRSNEEAQFVQVTASDNCKFHTELNGLLLNSEQNSCSSANSRQPHLQLQLQLQSQSPSLQTETRMSNQINHQTWDPVNTPIPVSVDAPLQSDNHIQIQNETHKNMETQAETTVQNDIQVKAQIDIPIQTPSQRPTQSLSEGQQELNVPTDLGNASEEMEMDFEPSCISSGPPFICDICNKSFGKVGYLYRHLRKHTGEFTCIACRAVFARKESLQLHECSARPMQSSGSNSERLSCPFCPRQFAAKKQLSRHIANHSGARHFQCSSCSRNFSSKEAREYHAKNCTSDPMHVDQENASRGSDTKQAVQSFRCVTCHCVFLSTTALQHHRVTKHQDGSLQDCKHCGRVMTLATPERLEKHSHFCAPAAALQAGNADEAVCPECNEPFRQLLLYRQHVYRHTHPFTCAHCQRLFRTLQERGKHVCLDRLEQCCLCGHRFGTVSQLERHALTHGVPNYHCFECGRSFHQVHDFNQHRCFELSLKVLRRARKKGIQIQSEDSPATTYVSSTSVRSKNLSWSEDILMCEICGKVFKNGRSLKTHSLLHGERKIECGICGKRFHRKDILAEHMYVHEDAQLHCSICNKILKSWKSLEVHIRRMHSAHKQFVCQQCGKEFRQKVHLRKHLRSHESRPQPVSCPHCKRRFHFPDALAKHVTEHMEVPTFHCTQCNHSFMKEKLLRQHMKHHVSQGYSCPVCGHTLKHRNSLRRHIIKLHPELSQGKRKNDKDLLEPMSGNIGQAQGPEVLLTVSQLQLTTEGMQQVSLPGDIAVENACLLEGGAMECSEDMVLYVLQEPLACLQLQESST